MPERRQRKTITDLYDDLEALQSLQEGSPILTDQNFRRISGGLAAYTVVRILANLAAISLWSRWDVADDAILRPGGAQLSHLESTGQTPGEQRAPNHKTQSNPTMNLIIGTPH